MDTQTQTNSENFEAFLVEKGYITQAVDDNLRKQSLQLKQPVVSIIASQKILNPQTLAQARGAFFNIPYKDFHDVRPTDEALLAIPRETEMFYKLFSFERDGTNLKVAVTDPTNLQALQALEFLSKKDGVTVQLYITDEDSFTVVMNKSQDLGHVVDQALESIQQTAKVEEKKNEEKDKAKASLQETIQDAPISKIVDVILANAIESNASDIHIEPEDHEIRVRYRVDGILNVALTLPLTVLPAIVSKIKILSNLKIDESRLPQDGRFHYETMSRSVDLRVSILPNVNGEKIVMRILDKSTRVPTLEQLGFRGKALEITKENLQKTNGIFLITGPTGSGKSTTLYAVLSELNSPNVNIVTLEDPVEYFMSGVNQTQINADIGLTFASGLRSILRQDPNIMMVGEIRDRETAELAVQSALTGHLVFSTLHTNSAAGAIPRLVDMGVESFLLAASLNAIGAQRLVRKLCVDCKHEVPASDAIKAVISKELQGVSAEELEGLKLDDIKIYEGAGCDKCGKTGYKGRVAILEMLAMTQPIQEMLISKQVSNQAILEEAKKNGMITMQQDGFIKVMQGVTSYEEVFRVITE
jgi:type IV pilus assembly protein PilB